MMRKNLPLIFIKSFFAFVVCTLGGIIFINYLCDPIQFIRRSPGKTLVSNQRLQVAGFVNTFDYNLLVVGNSMVEALPYKLIKELVPSAIQIPLAMPGSAIPEQIIPLAKALETGKVHTVIWGMPPNALSYMDKHSIPPSFPLYLYEGQIFKYLFNFRVFQFSFKNFFKSENTPDAELLENYRKKQDKFIVSKDIILELYRKDLNPIKTSCPKDIDYTDAKLQERNFLNDVLPIIKQYPQVQFYIFLPPHSLALYKLSHHNNCIGFENTVRVREFMFKNLTSLPNVKVYDFETDLGIVGNLENYQDLTHYRQSVKDEILTKMKNNFNLVTLDNLKEKTLAFRQQVLLDIA